jgi:hypothetical protein
MSDARASGRARRRKPSPDRVDHEPPAATPVEKLLITRVQAAVALGHFRCCECRAETGVQKGTETASCD